MVGRKPPQQMVDAGGNDCGRCGLPVFLGCDYARTVIDRRPAAERGPGARGRAVVGNENAMVEQSISVDGLFGLTWPAWTRLVRSTAGQCGEVRRVRNTADTLRNQSDAMARWASPSSGASVPGEVRRAG
jgi:hypothetical protein